MYYSNWHKVRRNLDSRRSRKGSELSSPRISHVPGKAYEFAVYLLYILIFDFRNVAISASCNSDCAAYLTFVKMVLMPSSEFVTNHDLCLKAWLNTSLASWSPFVVVSENAGYRFTGTSPLLQALNSGFSWTVKQTKKAKKLRPSRCNTSTQRPKVLGTEYPPWVRGALHTHTQRFSRLHAAAEHSVGNEAPNVGFNHYQAAWLQYQEYIYISVYIHVIICLCIIRSDNTGMSWNVVIFTPIIRITSLSKHRYCHLWSFAIDWNMQLRLVRNGNLIANVFLGKLLLHRQYGLQQLAAVVLLSLGFLVAARWHKTIEDPASWIRKIQGVANVQILWQYSGRNGCLFWKEDDCIRSGILLYFVIFRPCSVFPGNPFQLWLCHPSFLSFFSFDMFLFLEINIYTIVHFDILIAKALCSPNWSIGIGIQYSAKQGPIESHQVFSICFACNVSKSRVQQWGPFKNRSWLIAISFK